MFQEKGLRMDMGNQFTKVGSHHKVALNIEHFYNDEDKEFRVSSRKGVLSILQGIVDQGACAALFYGGVQNFIMTTLIGISEHGIWLDVGPFSPENRQVLLSDKITFVSVHQSVKVQFTARNIESGLFENNEAFYMELPDHLLRIQRREFFRMTIPPSHSVKCIIPIQPESQNEPVTVRELLLTDISGGGIGLLCDAHEDSLLPDKVFPDCRISIPDVGVMAVAVEVRNGINVIVGKNRHKRVGCRFVRLDNQMNMLLQRYINQLQSENIFKGVSS